MPYIPEEAVEAAKSVSAFQYMQDHESWNLFKKGHTYYMKEHDSLYFSNGYFRWSSATDKEKKGGKSAIDLLVKVRGMEYIDAVREICSLYNIDTTGKSSNFKSIIDANKAINDLFIKRDSLDAENRVFELPKPAKDNKRVYAYLKKRGISDNVIRYCFKKRYLYQEEKHGNCVFVGYDKEGIPKYAGQRSTGYITFKGDSTGSNKAYSFRLPCLTSNTVHLFEAPIDLLSYATYMEMEGYDFTRTNLLALSGVSIPCSNGETSIPNSIETLLDGAKIKTFVIHFDNDNPGKAASKALATVLANQGYEAIEVPVPEEYGKDVNDFILAYQSKKSKNGMVK